MPLFTTEDNRRLTRTDAGEPMGDLFRRYWIPAFVSKIFKNKTREPVPICLLGEPMVAIRDDRGVVVITANDREYPTHEAGQIVWIYMGDLSQKPSFPEFLFTTLPHSHVIVEMYLQEANWLQGLEGDLDFWHSPFAHGTLEQEGRPDAGTTIKRLGSTEAIETKIGIRLATVYRSLLVPGCNIYQDHPMIVPCYTSTRDNSGVGGLFHAWVPVDDKHHLVYYVHYDEAGPLDEEERQKIGYGWGHDMIQEEDDFRSAARLSNKHLQDWARCKKFLYSGIEGVATQDLAVVASMGAIVDRSLENLGSIDVAIIKARRFLLRMLLDFERTGTAPLYPLSIQDAEGAIWLIPENADWRDVVEGRVTDMRRDERPYPLSRTALVEASIRSREASAQTTA